MKLLISALLVMISFSAQARSTFSRLECKVAHPQPKDSEKAFLLVLTFQNPIEATNDSSFDKRIPADMTVTYLGGVQTESLSVPNVTLNQATSAYGHYLHLGNRFLGSSYMSFVNMHPEFKNGRLRAYAGELELNVLIQGVDAMIMKTEYLKCEAK